MCSTGEGRNDLRNNFFSLIRELRRILLLIFGGMERITDSLELGENQPRPQGLFPPPNQGKGPGDEVGRKPECKTAIRHFTKLFKERAL